MHGFFSHLPFETIGTLAHPATQEFEYVFPSELHTESYSVKQMQPGSRGPLPHAPGTTLLAPPHLALQALGYIVWVATSHTGALSLSQLHEPLGGVDGLVLFTQVPDAQDMLRIRIAALCCMESLRL